MPKAKIITLISLPKEEWRIAPNFESYSVSNFGRIIRNCPGKGTQKNRLLNPRPNKDGYFMLDLQGKGIAIYRLVAFAFIGPCPEGKEVNHIDGNKANNIPSNLEYLTKAENIAHAMANGLRPPERHRTKLYPWLTPRGENCAKSKIRERDVLAIRNAKLTPEFTRRRLAEKYNITIHQVWMIRARRSWKHVP